MSKYESENLLCTESRDELWNEFIRAVQQEVKPAVGCTEPVSLALAAAVAASYLPESVERIEARVSPNLMKMVWALPCQVRGWLGCRLPRL